MNEGIDQRTETSPLARPQAAPTNRHAVTAGNSGQPCQQNEHPAYAVRSKCVADSHRWHPRRIDEHLPALSNTAQEPERSDREARKRNYKREPSCQGRLALGQQRFSERSGKREINRPG